MDKKLLKTALAKLNDISPKRKFKQTVDLIFNFKDIDLKKTDNHIDYYAQLHFIRGKKVKVCALVGPELADSAKDACDLVINVADFSKYAQDKKLTKKLAEEYDYFIAQATIMPKVAQNFGKVFGPRQKMPNPKAGCVVPPNANLKPLVERLQKTVRIQVKQKPMFQTYIGLENTNEEELIDNAITLYNSVLQHVPQQKNNIKIIYIKHTMGPVVKLTTIEEINATTKEKETTKDKKPKKSQSKEE